MRAGKPQGNKPLLPKGVEEFDPFFIPEKMMAVATYIPIDLQIATDQDRLS